MKKLAIFLSILFAASPAFAQFTYGQLRVANTASQSTTQISSTSIPFQSATICAGTGNTGIMVYGGSSVVAALATRKGVPLAAGVCRDITCNNTMLCGDLNKLYVGSTVSNDNVTVFYQQSDFAL